MEAPRIPSDAFLEQWRQFEIDATKAAQNPDALDDKMYRQMRRQFKKFAKLIKDNNWSRAHAIRTSLGSATWDAWIPKDKTNFHHLFKKGLKRYEGADKSNATKKLIQENGHTEEGQASRSRKEMPILPSNDNVDVSSSGTPMLTGNEITMQRSVSTVDVPVPTQNGAPAGSATTEPPNSVTRPEPSQEIPSPTPPQPLGEKQKSSLDAPISPPLVDEQIFQQLVRGQNDITEDFSVGAHLQERNGAPEQNETVQNSSAGANVEQQIDIPPRPGVDSDVSSENDTPRYLNADAKSKGRARDSESAQTLASIAPSEEHTKIKKRREPEINHRDLPQPLPSENEIQEGRMPENGLNPLGVSSEEATGNTDTELVRPSREDESENPQPGDERPTREGSPIRKRTNVEESPKEITHVEDAEVQDAEEYIKPCNQCEIRQRQCLKYLHPDGKKNRVKACEACRIHKQKCTYSRRGQNQAVKRSASENSASEDEEPLTKKVKIESAVAGASRPSGRPRLTEEQKQKNREKRRKARAAAERAMKKIHSMTIEVDSEIQVEEIKILKNGEKYQGTRNGNKQSLQRIESHLADLKEEMTMIRASMMQLDASNQSIKTCLTQFMADARYAFRKYQPDLNFLP